MAEFDDIVINGIIKGALVPVRGDCRVAVQTAENISTIAPGDTLDGVVINVGERILFVAQANPIENGIYIMDTPPFRSSDMSTGDIVGGITVRAEQGSKPFTTWMCTTPLAVVDTDDLIFDRAYDTNSFGTVGDGTNTDQNLVNAELGTDNLQINYITDLDTIAGNTPAFEFVNETDQNIGLSFDGGDRTAYRYRSDTRNTLESRVADQRFIWDQQANALNFRYYNATSSIGSLMSAVVSPTQITSIDIGTSNTVVSLTGSQISADGPVRLDDYGAGSITGTAAYNLTVDSSGNVIESSLGGGSFGTPRNYGELYHSGTVILFNLPLKNTWYKITFTSVLGLANDFDRPVTSRLRYTGTDTKKFRAVAHISHLVYDSTIVNNGSQMQFSMFKNGLIIDSSLATNIANHSKKDYVTTTINCLVELAQNDYLELYIKNVLEDAKNVIISNVNLTTTEADGSFTATAANIYNQSDSLTGPRTVTLNSHSLSITDSTSTFFLGSNYLVATQASIILGTTSTATSISDNVTLSTYGQGNKTGTIAYDLHVNSSGLIVENKKAFISIYDTTSQYFSTTLTTVSFDTVQVTSGDFTLASGQLTVNKAGTYLITYDLSVDQPFNTTRSSSKAVLYNNSTNTTVPGTESYGYHRQKTNGENTFTCTTMLTITAGTIFTVRIQRIAGTTLCTVPQGCRLNFMEITS